MFTLSSKVLNLLLGAHSQDAFVRFSLKMEVSVFCLMSAFPQQLKVKGEPKPRALQRSRAAKQANVIYCVKPRCLM